MFLDHIYFSPTYVSLPFFFFSAGFSCPLCFLVSIVLLASFVTDIPVRGGHSFSHPLPPFSFFLSVPPHVFGPMSGSDVVGSAGCSHCGLPVVSWDWWGLGQTVLELHRLGPPESLHYQGTCSTTDYDGKALFLLLVHLEGFLFNFVCFLKEVLFSVSSTDTFLLKLVQICISGREEEWCSGSWDSRVLCPSSDAYTVTLDEPLNLPMFSFLRGLGKIHVSSPEIHNVVILLWGSRSDREGKQERSWAKHTVLRKWDRDTWRGEIWLEEVRLAAY